MFDGFNLTNELIYVIQHTHIFLIAGIGILLSVTVWIIEQLTGLINRPKKWNSKGEYDVDYYKYTHHNGDYWFPD